MKENLVVESQAYCEGKQETSIHEILSIGFYLWLGTFQQDFYTTVILKTSKITHEAQYVDWEYMARKNNAIFNEVMAECANKRIKALIGFKHS